MGANVSKWILDSKVVEANDDKLFLTFLKLAVSCGWVIYSIHNISRGKVLRKSRFLTFVSYDNRQPFQFHIFYSFIFASSCLSLHFCLILFVSSFLSHLVCLFIFVSSCLSLHFCLFRGVLGLTVTFRSLSKTGLSNSIVSLILNSYLNFQFIDVCLKKEMFLSLKREMFEKRNEKRNVWKEKWFRLWN